MAKRPAGVCKLLQTFEYRGVKVFVRQWHDCFEWITAMGDNVYTGYVEVNDFADAHGKDREDVVKNMISMCSSQAASSIDQLLHKRSVKQRIKNFLPSFNVKKQFRHDGVEPEKPAA